MKIKYLFVIILFIYVPLYGEERYSIPIEDSPSIGPEDAPVTIIEFLDYQ